MISRVGHIEILHIQKLMYHDPLKLGKLVCDRVAAGLDWPSFISWQSWQLRWPSRNHIRNNLTRLNLSLSSLVISGVVQWNIRTSIDMRYFEYCVCFHSRDGAAVVTPQIFVRPGPAAQIMEKTKQTCRLCNVRSDKKFVALFQQR